MYVAKEYPEVPSPTSHHRLDELRMANAPDIEPINRPSIEYIRLWDKQEKRWRPAVISFPSARGTSWAVIHTADDHDREVKTTTKRQYKDYLEDKVELWSDVPPEIMDYVEKAVRGDYDEVIEMLDIESPLSFVMKIVEDAYDAEGRAYA